MNLYIDDTCVLVSLEPPVSSSLIRFFHKKKSVWQQLDDNLWNKGLTPFLAKQKSCTSSTITKTCFSPLIRVYASLFFSVLTGPATFSSCLNSPIFYPHAQLPFPLSQFANFLQNGYYYHSDKLKTNHGVTSFFNQSTLLIHVLKNKICYVLKEISIFFSMHFCFVLIKTQASEIFGPQNFRKKLHRHKLSIKKFRALNLLLKKNLHRHCNKLPKSQGLPCKSCGSFSYKIFQFLFAIVIDQWRRHPSNCPCDFSNVELILIVLDL